jgi:arylsulfatase A-like enzyme
MDANMTFPTNACTRRKFLGTVTGAAGGMAATSVLSGAAPAVVSKRPPNILFINLDQLNAEAVGLHGCPDVKTPNMDRLGRSGMSFTQSYSTNPVCCPARSSWFTGRMTPETGVTKNGLKMVTGMPDLGQWMRQSGYQTFYSGKWHIPGRDVRKSFTEICPNPKNTARLCDIIVSRSAEGFMRNYRESDPFFLSVGLLNPHDICSFVLTHDHLEGRMPFPELESELPPLPPNFNARSNEPGTIVTRREKYFRERGNEAGMGAWEDNLWRYYIWAYYRYIEMVDAHVGRVLDALEDSPHARNTVVILSSDHGDGNARHAMVFKSFLYDEAARVPTMISWPDHIPAGGVDDKRLVSGVDVFPTACDYAGVAPPPNMRGYSLRAAAEGRSAPGHDFVVSHSGAGRMIRTDQYKLITYKNDPVTQLFDMKADPWETRNLAGESSHAATVEEHRKALDEFDASLELAPPAPTPQPKKTKAGGASQRS